MSRRKWGDRIDGRRIKNPHGLQGVMFHLLPKRTECEVCLTDILDITNLLQFLEKENLELEKSGEDYKITLFHCFVAGLTKMVNERPLLNRFVQGRRLYERFDISISFVAKRRFRDHAEEALMFLVPKGTDTIKDISKKISGDVHETRKSETSSGGIDGLLDSLNKLPMPILAMIVAVVRFLDFWGINLKSLMKGDPNHSTILISNLGSIKCPAVYHHLNNYGSNSIMITVGTIHKQEMIMPDGTKQIRDVVDYAVTVDERIADGFYFARSLKLMKHIFNNPEILCRPINESSGFDYK